MLLVPLGRLNANLVDRPAWPPLLATQPNSSNGPSRKSSWNVQSGNSQKAITNFNNVVAWKATVVPQHLPDALESCQECGLFTLQYGVQCWTDIFWSGTMLCSFYLRQTKFLLEVFPSHGQALAWSWSTDEGTWFGSCFLKTFQCLAFTFFCFMLSKKSIFACPLFLQKLSASAPVIFEAALLGLFSATSWEQSCGSVMGFFENSIFNLEARKPVFESYWKIKIFDIHVCFDWNKCSSSNS